MYVFINLWAKPWLIPRAPAGGRSGSCLLCRREVSAGDTLEEQQGTRCCPWEVSYAAGRWGGDAQVLVFPVSLVDRRGHAKLRSFSRFWSHVPLYLVYLN